MTTRGKRTARESAEFFRAGYAYLLCRIGPTRFKDECAVYIQRLDGGTTVALASHDEVKVETPLTEIRNGEALVRVVERIKGGFVIDPPGESLNSAGRVQVPEAAVKFS